MLKRKFDIVFEQIMSQLNQNIKYFETFDDAKDFFNKNYDGHCIIYSNDGKLLETCRCMTFIHDRLNLPKAIINMSEQVYKQQQREKFKDDTFYSEFFKNKQVTNKIKYHIQKITNFQMGQIIASHQIINHNKRMNNDFANLKKLLYDDQMIWSLLKNNQNRIVACAALSLEKYNIVFINEIFSFQKGCGSILLLNILNNDKYSMVYLHSDWSQKQSLNQYYRDPKFNLTEYVYHRDHYDVHYFYKNNFLNKNQLNNFIQDEMI